MSSEEINKYIHTQILGKCWHDFGKDGLQFAYCQKCGGLVLAVQPNPDYCSDDSPRRLLNAVVAKVCDQVGEQELGLSLFKQTFGYEFTGGRFDGSITVVGAMKYARATAEQIATACVEAHKESK